jgi:predicted anti-sigma-YlaC factor YlaD
MTSHEQVRDLLPLSAAGLLEAAEERRVREHARECPDCAAELAALGELAAQLAILPSPAPPPDLLARTQARVAADRERREAFRLGLAAVACALIIVAAVCMQLQPIFGPMVWLAAAIGPSVLGAGAAVMLVSHLRPERSF